MICEDCKNNKDDECKICILEDGSCNKISKKQKECDYKDKNEGWDLREQVKEKTMLELKIEELEQRISTLEQLSDFTKKLLE